MDLSRKHPPRNMLKSILGKYESSGSSGFRGFQKQEDVKLYGQLPDYDDFQRYDMGTGGHFTSYRTKNL